MFIEVLKPPKFVPGRKKGSGGYQEQPPKVHGPVTVTFDMEYTTFLDVMAKTTFAGTRDNLIPSSMAWRWTKLDTSRTAASRASLPLTSADGFKTMFEQIKVSNLQSSGMLFVSMAPPQSGEAALTGPVSVSRSRILLVCIEKTLLTTGHASPKGVKS